MEKAVNCWLQRHKSGVKVTVKVIPEIEDFFKTWGGGFQEGPQYGRLWKPMKSDGTQLSFWGYEKAAEEETNYSLNKTGAALFDEYHGSGVNISFLRMVGASGENGCEFMVESPMSTEEMDRVGTAIVKAGEQFYLNYIRPVNINCFVGVIDYSKAGSAVLDGR